MDPKKPKQSSDEEALDQIFAEMVEAVSDGQSVRLEQFLPDRPELHSQIKQLHQLAEEIAVRKPRTIPHLEGYEILGELGHGGMGTVYLARQQRPNRLVALKTLSGRLLAGERARVRFEREGHAIARLDHASIVSVYAMGEMDGIPFFTMEYVKGLSLDEVIRKLRDEKSAPAQLSGRELTAIVLGDEHAAVPVPWVGSWYQDVSRILVQVAFALQHAHDNQIIHRDIKPSNIMLRRDGQALLFDFGLAKEDDEDQALTMTGDFVGSPYYVSPEQADRRRGNVDARSDVYSLGVTLYELLTLEVPFRGTTTQDILNKILDTEPVAPRRIRKSIPADLNVICLTAMDKDPARRYPTAAHFAEDLKGFLAKEPIQARPMSTGTRTLRFVQRNQALSAAIGLGLLLVVGTPIVMLIQKSAALNDIEQQMRKVQAINDYQLDLFESIDARVDGKDVKVRDVLEKAVKGIKDAYLDEPEIGISLRNIIGKTYMRLGMRDEGISILRDSLDIANAHLPADHVDRLEALEELATGLRFTEEFDEALSLLREALSLRIESKGESSKETLYVMSLLGSILCVSGNFDEGEEYLFRALDLRRQKFGPIHTEVLESLLSIGGQMVLRRNNLEQGSIYLNEAYTLITEHGLGNIEHQMSVRSLLADSNFHRRNWEEAAKYYEENIRLADEHYEPDYPIGLTARNGLANVWLNQGKAEQAELKFRKLLADNRRIHGHTHRETLAVINNLCVSLHRQNSNSEKLLAARELLVDSIAKMLEKYDENHPDVLALQQNEAMNYAYAGEMDEAAKRMQTVGNKRSATIGKNHRMTIESLFLFGRFQELSGRHRLAAKTYADVLERSNNAEYTAYQMRCLTRAGVCNIKCGEHALGEKFLQDAIKFMEDRQVPETDANLKEAKAVLKSHLDTQTRVE